MDHAIAGKIYNALKVIPAIRMVKFLKNALENRHRLDLTGMPEDMLVRLATVHELSCSARGDYYPDEELLIAFYLLLDDIGKMDKKAFLNGNCIEDHDSWSCTDIIFDPVHLGPEVTQLFRDALDVDVTRYSDGSLSLYLSEIELVHLVPILKRIMRATEIEVSKTGESEYKLDFIGGDGWDLVYNLVYNAHGAEAVKSGEEHINSLWWLEELELEDGYALIDCGEGIYRVEKYEENEQ